MSQTLVLASVDEDAMEQVQKTSKAFIWISKKAIPINMVKSIKDQLVTAGKVSRGYLGVSIQYISSELKESFDLKATEGVLLLIQDRQYARYVVLDLG